MHKFHSFRSEISMCVLTFGSARALITFPRARSERLMLAPSRSRAPLAFVALARSEPARSIRLILATQTLGLRLAVLSCCLKNIWEKAAQRSQLETLLGVVHIKDITKYPTDMSYLVSFNVTYVSELCFQHGI